MSRGRAKPGHLKLHGPDARPKKGVEETGAKPEAGVYEEEIHPPGEHWYKIVMPSGNVGIVHFPDELCDEEVVRTLWKRFFKKSSNLKIVP